jgi:hypothetical protein
MNKKLIQKIIKEEIFVKYQINESFDIPFNNIKRIDSYNYIVDEDGVQGIFTFHVLFNNNELNDYDFYNKKIDTYYELSWIWGSNMKPELKTTSNWIKMTTTSFKIIDSFIREKKPLLIKFAPRTGGNKKVYFHTEFTDKLETIFAEHFDVIVDNKKQRVFLVNKEVSRLKEDSIRKLSEYIELFEAWKYWKYPKKNKTKGTVRNDLVKEQQKRILYKWKYVN